MSQAGQDYWVFGEVFNEKKGGYFLDIGAHNGINISNTYILEKRYGWSGICIEANPITFNILKKVRQATCLNVCLDSDKGEVDFVLRDAKGGILAPDLDNKEVTENTTLVRLKTLPLIHVLEEQNAPNVIDFLSIDIEGAEERVLGDFDFTKYTFRCITIERPSDVLRKLLQEHDYILIKEIPGLDCFYLHRSFVKEYRKNLVGFYGKRYFAYRWTRNYGRF